MNPTRRKILKTGAAATAMAAVPRVFAEIGQGQQAAAIPTAFYEKGPVKIHYEDTGSGFPLLVIPGGGHNSVMSGVPTMPFNPIAEFKGEYRIIAADLRNAINGQSSGPLEVDRPWDMYTDDFLGVLDKLKVNKFVLMGFCIGGPLEWALMKRVPDRVVAAVVAQPVGFRKEKPTVVYDNQKASWGAELVKRRPDITADMVDKFLFNAYRKTDFVFTASRDFVRNCQTPVLVLPDDTDAHGLDTAIESAMLAPKAEMSMYPWKEPKERIPLAVRHIRSFLKANRPAAS